MRAIHLLSGCVLGLCLSAAVHASTSVVAASDGMGDGGRSTSAGNGSAPSNGVATALSDLSRTPAPGSRTPSSDDQTTGSAIRSGGNDDGPPPAHRHQVSLGWQSLLPGSIQ